MLPLVAWSTLGHPPFNPREAPLSGIRILEAFGVPGPYPLLGSRVGDSPETLWIEVGSDGGQKYSFRVLTTTGRCLSVQRRHESRIVTASPSPPSFDDASVAHLATARHGLSRLMSINDLLRPRCVSFGTREILFFPVGFGGHPLLSPSQYRFRVILDRDSGAFEEFEHLDVLPEPERTPTRLTQAQAVKSTKDYLATHLVHYYSVMDRPIQYHVGYDLPQTMPYKGPGPALGWLRPRGEKRLRLAWAVPYWDKALEDLTKNKWTGADEETNPNTLALLYIDAATGERIVSDDVPMERYS